MSIDGVSEMFKAMDVNGKYYKLLTDTRIYKDMKSLHETAAQLLIKESWPPPLHLPTLLMKQIITLDKQGKCSESVLAKKLYEFFDSEQVLAMLSEWEEYDCFASRSHLVSEAVDNYIVGKFASCVAVLLPCLEGIIGESITNRNMREKDIRALFSRSEMDRVAKKFFIDEVRKQFEWENNVDSGLSRHQISHGKDTCYGTQENALKVILLFDALIPAVDRAKNEKTIATC